MAEGNLKNRNARSSTKIMLEGFGVENPDQYLEDVIKNTEEYLNQRFDGQEVSDHDFDIELKRQILKSGVIQDFVGKEMKEESQHTGIMFGDLELKDTSNMDMKEYFGYQGEVLKKEIGLLLTGDFDGLMALENQIFNIQMEKFKMSPAHYIMDPKQAQEIYRSGQYADKLMEALKQERQEEVLNTMSENAKDTPIEDLSNVMGNLKDQAQKDFKENSQEKTDLNKTDKELNNSDTISKIDNDSNEKSNKENTIDDDEGR